MDEALAQIGFARSLALTPQPHLPLGEWEKGRNERYLRAPLQSGEGQRGARGEGQKAASAYSCKSLERNPNLPSDEVFILTTAAQQVAFGNISPILSILAGPSGAKFLIQGIQEARTFFILWNAEFIDRIDGDQRYNSLNEIQRRALAGAFANAAQHSLWMCLM